MTEFRKAGLQDTDSAWAVVDEARNAMLANGRKQWTKEYPARQDILNDIAGGHAYILTDDGTAAAYATMSVNGEPEYAHIEGHWLSDGSYVVMHRLAVRPSHRGKGMAKRFFQEMEAMASSHGIHSIKVDTNYDNVEMLHLLPQLGYAYCGKISYAGKGERMAFEKLI